MHLPLIFFLLVASFPGRAVEKIPEYYSAELFTENTISYGRVDVRMKVAKGAGVVSSFFLWKKESEKPDVFWNEVDIEIPGNNTFGFYSFLHSGHHKTNDVSESEKMKHDEGFLSSTTDLSLDFHVYSIEWTPDCFAWLLDGQVLRKTTSSQVKDFNNVSMQIRFNIWPSARPKFAGEFSGKDLPVEQVVDWIEYSEYKPNSAKKFYRKWKEDFLGNTLKTKWKLAE